MNLSILETVVGAELLPSSINGQTHVALLPCPANWLVCFVVSVVEIWKVSMSESLLAELQMQVLYYTRKIKGVKKLDDFCNGI